MRGPWLALHTTCPLRCVRTSCTMQRVMCGPWGWACTSAVHASTHSMLKTRYVGHAQQRCMTHGVLLQPRQLYILWLEGWSSSASCLLAVSELDCHMTGHVTSRSASAPADPIRVALTWNS